MKKFSTFLENTYSDTQEDAKKAFLDMSTFKEKHIKKVVPGEIKNHWYIHTHRKGDEDQKHSVYLPGHPLGGHMGDFETHN